MSQKPSLIILSGGRATRLNGADKGLYLFQGQFLITHVINALQAQVDDIIISANRNIKQYSELGFKVVNDGNNDFEGPLKGLCESLDFCAQEKVLVTTCDMPFIAEDLMTVFDLDATEEIQVIAVKERKQLCFLMKKSLAPSLAVYLEEGGKRVMQWIESCHFKEIDYQSSAEHFKNFNSIQDFSD